MPRTAERLIFESIAADRMHVIDKADDPDRLILLLGCCDLYLSHELDRLEIRKLVERLEAWAG
jgi:hypothetical protein